MTEQPLRFNPPALRERLCRNQEIVDSLKAHGESSRPWSIPYEGQPYFVSEFGGIWWNPSVGRDEYSWGYGGRLRDVEEFYERFERFCGTLLENPRMFGYCYTQLTDVYQEQTGIYTLQI